MTIESLEAAMRRAGGPVPLLRNSPGRPFTFPVAPEFTNWRSETRAWHDACALLDQSHHMTDLFISGRDALKLLSDLGVNSFAAFTENKAKQFVAVNHDGYFIGDGILFYLGKDSFDLVNTHPAVLDWVEYNLASGGYDATIERDENSADRPNTPPKLYRYELQGPNAPEIMLRVAGCPIPDIKFFGMSELSIAGRRVRALRHGMAGQPGFELFGPWQEGAEVRGRLLEAGEDLGLVCAGAKAYSAANLESGWIPSPMPAIFAGEELRAFREWRRADRAGSLGGSLNSGCIEDYYVTPFDIGYGRHVAFDHDFVGSTALAELARDQRRTKVTLVWNIQDVGQVMTSFLEDGSHAKYIDFPKARYALFQADEVRHGGKQVGISMDCGYLYNERVMVSLATIDRSFSTPGTEVTLIWGEAPNSSKPQVEPHHQVEIRATVAPAPYGKVARSSYRSA